MVILCVVFEILLGNLGIMMNANTHCFQVKYYVWVCGLGVCELYVNTGSLWEVELWTFSKFFSFFLSCPSFPHLTLEKNGLK